MNQINQQNINMNQTPKNIDLGIDLDPATQRWIEQRLLILGAVGLTLTYTAMFTAAAVTSVLVAGLYGLAQDQDQDQTNKT